MTYSKCFLISALIASANAYSIAFDVLGYDHTTNPVRRVGEMLWYDIPGQVGRDRCFNIIPPLFDESTPLREMKDVYKANNMRQRIPEYFYSDTLRDPATPKFSLYDKAPYLSEGVEGELPDIEITEIAVESIFDPESVAQLGAAGPVPQAIAFYARRDCVSRANFRQPGFIIRFHQGEGLQIIGMNNVFPETGTVQIQSWEEVDENSRLWKAYISALPIRPKDVLNKNYNSDSEGTTYSDEPDEGPKRSDRLAPGDGYVVGPQPWRQDVVELDGFVPDGMLYEAHDSLDMMKNLWPGIEDYGYYGDDRTDPQVRPDGSEYIYEDWAPDEGFSNAYDLLKEEAELSDTASEWDFPAANPNAAKFDFVSDGSKTPLPAYAANPIFEAVYEQYLEENSDDQGSDGDLGDFKTDYN
ncbi:hypothetical protein H072_6916 [Dactylellina haptotyla CBS 200.50]|uniref:Uncharacterized protein n=1 Tax=Dactylellina haptotyla (strain CBS 200.50) TaxID=1284197 RepID=S8BVG2_DACHA|nr:hypothetical protein H072_6916 [Dactylellina haptotyla CBS 200.50]